jgi:hypothetical protein
MTVTAAKSNVGGQDGWRLENGTAEAFVITTPYPRVVSFRLAGGESPLRTSLADPFYGIRTWFLEPTQLPTAPLPALQLAQAGVRPDGTLQVAAGVEPQTQLQVVQDISLDADRPILRIRHGLVNHADRSRRLAAWSINVVPHAGVAVAPWSTAADVVRSCLFWPRVSPGDPAIMLGERALGVDFRKTPALGWLKVGTNTDAGWIAYLWSGGALVSSVPHEKGGEYPEGGGTITLYSSGQAPDQGFCELEHVGPLTDVAPGGVVELMQTLELLPAVSPAGDTPDAWLAAIQQRTVGCCP